MNLIGELVITRGRLVQLAASRVDLRNHRRQFRSDHRRNG